jgi:RNA polymerase sigma factor (sigma-70 family)
MTRNPIHAALGHLRKLASREAEPLPDAELLERFVTAREETAFASLVHRHGPLVLGVCRRALQDPHDAEDVFQATFLVFAKKAASIRKSRSLGSWLYGVAHRLALRARSDAARRRKHERARAEAPVAGPTPDVTWRELQAGLDEELANLPERYRAPLLLCYLEGKTQDEAARHLHWSLGTFRRRLDRARELLRTRLARRGLTLSAALFATALAENVAGAAVPAALADEAVRTGLAVGAGQVLGASPTPAAALAAGALRALAAARLKRVVFLIVLALLGGGAALALSGFFQASAPAEAPQGRPAADDRGPKPSPGAVDLHGDPLPPGALARLGTVRFRVGDGIHSAALSPDGKTLAVVRSSGEVILWGASGKPLPVTGPLALPAGGIAFSPDGRRLVTACPGNKVKLWEAASGKVVWSAGGQPLGLIAAVAFSPDGKRVASIGQGVPLHVRDAATGKELWTVTGNQQIPTRFLAFSPDGKLLAARGQENGIALYETDSGQLVRSLAGHTRAVDAVAFAPDGERLVSGGRDEAVRLWYVPDGRQLWRWGAFPEQVRALAYAPDGKTIAVCGGGEAPAVTLQDVGTGDRLRNLGRLPRGPVTLAFSTNGKTLTAVGNVAVRMWEVAGGKELAPFPGHTGGLLATAVSPDGRLVATAGLDCTVRLWERATGKTIHRMSADTGPVFALAFSPDGKTLASGGWWSGEVRLWRVATGAQLEGIPGKGGHVSALAFSPDGKTLAVGNRPLCRFDLYDVATGKELQHFRKAECVHALTFSPDGKLLAVGFSGHLRRAGDRFDNNVLLWDTAAGRVVRELEAPPIAYNSLAFSPDGKLLTSAAGGQLRLWEAATGKLLWLHKFQDPTTAAHSVAFSPDGRALATAGYKPSVRVWELATRKQRLALDDPRGSALSLAFTPDGRALVTASTDSSALIWDMAGPPARGGKTGSGVQGAGR